MTSGYDCSNPPASNFSGNLYPAGSSLMQFSSNAYFIRSSEATGLPPLYRQALIVSSDDAATKAQEVVGGVENLQIIYAVDTDATPDGKFDRYHTADNIPQNVADAGSGSVGWDRVVAVRVTLILRSAREVSTSDTVADLGEGYSYNDRYMRQKVSTTVRIRNRGLAVEA